MIDFFKSTNSRTSAVIKQAIDLSFGYITFSPEGNIKECNGNFLKLMGYNGLQDIRGKHHSIFVTPDEVESAAYKEFWKDLGQGAIKSGEFHRRTADGHDVFLRASYTPLIDRSGNVKEVIKIANDVTEERKSMTNSIAIRNAIDLSFAFIRFDMKGNIKEANQPFVEAMGYQSAEDIIGQHHSIFVTKEERENSSYKKFWDDLNRGEVQTGEFKRLDKSGEVVWLQASYSPVGDNNGNYHSVVKIATDITQRKVAFDHATDLRDTIDLSFGYIQFKPDGTIIDVNRNFCQLLGYSDESEVLHRHHQIFIEHEYAQRKEYSKFWQDLKAGKTQSGQFRRISKSGEEVWIQAAYTPVKDFKGEITSVIKVAADVTASKMEATESRRNLKNELFDNIKEIASAIGEIAGGAQSQVVKTDETSRSVEQATTFAGDMETKAHAIAEAAKTGESNSQNGSKIISGLVADMNDLMQEAGRAQDYMSLLEQRTKEISSILQVIQEIAAKTNLLSLNASIEAAQAGDSGRGFSVIAHEIRMLAENSKDSALEIEQKVTQMMSDTLNMAQAMTKVSEQVKNGNSSTAEASDIFQTILNATKNTSDLSGAILNSAIDQKGQLHEILTNSEDIVVIAEQTASGSEEVAAATKILEDRVSAL
ncbi:MAG: PAS domain-containing methyl-accepting chemotaxis protein [Ekhidna sp.]|nr:PAS domain-containing methyl-accepting chemotaxis protein [Ekhidna sp.]